MVTRRRRLLLISLAGVLVLVLGLALVVSLPGVQRAGWDRATKAITDSTGWRVDAGSVAFRPWPGRLELGDVAVGAEGRTVVTIERIAVRWRWRDLFRDVPRLRQVTVEELHADLRGDLPELTSREPSAGAAVDPFRVIEIDHLALRGGDLLAAFQGVAVDARGVQLSGELRGAAARARVDVGTVELTREGRTLALTSTVAEASASASGVSVERLEMGGAVELRASGSVETGDGGVRSAAGHVELKVAPGEVAAWWNPELAARAGLVGRLDLSGDVAWSADVGLRLDLRHVGQPIEVAGMVVDRLALETVSGAPRLTMAGPGWGRAEVTLRPDGSATVHAELDGLAAARLAELAGSELPVRLPPSLRLSGPVDLTVPPSPVEPASLLGQADLIAVWDDGRASASARFADGRASLSELRLEAPGATLTGAGTVALGGALEADLHLEVIDSAAFEAEARRWAENLPTLPEVGGGPLTMDLRLGGTAEAPTVSTDLAWQTPVLAGQQFSRVAASARGDLNEIEWQAAVDTGDGLTASAEGTAALRERTAAGRFEVEAADLSVIAARVPGSDLPALAGAVTARGTFNLTADVWQAEVSASGKQLAIDRWVVDEAELEATATPQRVTVTSAAVRLAGGEVHATGSASVQDLDGPLELTLDWDGIELAELIAELPEALTGRLDGSLRVTGSTARPDAELGAEWHSTAASPAVEHVALTGGLAGGVIMLATTRVEAAPGPLDLRVVAPIGDFPRPSWLWPDAPGGPVQARVRGQGMDTSQLLAALGQPEMPARATFDLAADGRWSPADPADRALEVRLEALEITGANIDLKAQQTVVMTLDGSVVDLEPVELVGPRSRIEAAGRVDLAAKDLRASLEAELAPELLSLLPVPLRGTKPLHLAVELAGPWNAPIGSVHVKHPDGTIVLRDPPVEIRDLNLIADVRDGAVTIREGSAGVNRGTVTFGGGWDPASGQGIVFELKDVVFLLPGQIISRWSGDLSVGPTRRGLALVEGELVLDGGMWDAPVSLADLIAGEGTAPLAADDPLFGILLDIDVRGRGGIQVNNNLGKFDLGWSVLSITGTAAEPRVVGEVKIAPGGVLTVGGQAVKLQRGTIELTGEPGAEPQVDLVPETGTTFGAGGGGATWDDLARLGLAQGVTSVLGLNNEALEPADIAVETEKPPATRFSIGQSIGRHLALFFTTDLRQPQDTTTLLQLWNLRRLPGLALQGFSSTNEQWGWAAIERASWGGSPEAGEGPIVRKVNLEGPWPLSKRRLRRAVGVTPGQPFDPFLVFVGELRLERALAEEGYYAAVVDGEASTDERRRALTFRAEPGPRQAFEFRGDKVKTAWRREVEALYLPPPLEKTALQTMKGDLERRLAATEHPDARVDVLRDGDVVVVQVDEGPKLKLIGPRVVGLPPGAADFVSSILGSPAELASLDDAVPATKARVERLLDREGYPDAKVVSIRREPIEKGVAEVVVEVDPGTRLEVASVRLDGTDPLGALPREGENLAPGSPVSRRRLDDVARRIRRTYREAGYVEATVRLDVERADQSRAPTVVVRLEPGPLRMVESVDISGLRHLKESVVRHGVEIRPGQPLSPSGVDQTVENLAGFRPIQRVEVRSIPTGPDAAKVEVEVFEKDRWTAGGGARWTSDRGTEAVLDLRDDNLLGRGFSLNLRGRKASDEQDGLVLLSLPPLPGNTITVSGSVHFNTLDTPGPIWVRRRETREATLEMNRQINVGAVERVYYTFSRVHNYDVDSTDIFPYDTTTDIGTVGVQFYRDRLDNPFLPSRGSYVSADLGWSPQALGSDLDTARSFLTGSMAWSPRRDVTFYQSLRLGVAVALTGELDPVLKFKTGGQGTIRGFEFESVGHTVEYGGIPDVVGGGALLILNEELRVRVWGGLRFAVFVDAGQAWESWSRREEPLAVGAGFGFRWATPIGPIWGDVAWPVANPGLNSGPKFYIGFGRPF